MLAYRPREYITKPAEIQSQPHGDKDISPFEKQEERDGLSDKRFLEIKVKKRNSFLCT